MYSGRQTTVKFYHLCKVEVFLLPLLEPFYLFFPSWFLQHSVVNRMFALPFRPAESFDFLFSL